MATDTRPKKVKPFHGDDFPAFHDERVALVVSQVKPLYAYWDLIYHMKSDYSFKGVKPALHKMRKYFCRIGLMELFKKTPFIVKYHVSPIRNPLRVADIIECDSCLNDRFYIEEASRDMDAAGLVSNAHRKIWLSSSEITAQQVEAYQREVVDKALPVLAELVDTYLSFNAKYNTPIR